jgi:hypothetical protein
VSPPKVTEGGFQLSLLGLCNPLVKKCYGSQQFMKIEYMGNLIPPAPPHDLVVISVMQRTFYKNGERMMGKLGNMSFIAGTNALNLYSQLSCLFLSLSQATYAPDSSTYTSSI